MITDEQQREIDVHYEENDKPFRGDDDLCVPQSFDARAWAKEWLRTIEKHPGVPTDEGTMITWFANAIMAGHDEIQRRNRDSLEIGDAWKKDSSLERWFPFTAEEISALKAKITKARELIDKSMTVYVSTANYCREAQAWLEATPP